MPHYLLVQLIISAYEYDSTLILTEDLPVFIIHFFNSSRSF